MWMKGVKERWGRIFSILSLEMGDAESVEQAAVSPTRLGMVDSSAKFSHVLHELESL